MGDIFPINTRASLACIHASVIMRTSNGIFGNLKSHVYVIFSSFVINELMILICNKLCNNRRTIISNIIDKESNVILQMRYIQNTIYQLNPNYNLQTKYKNQSTNKLGWFRSKPAFAQSCTDPRLLNFDGITGTARRVK